MKPPSTEDVEDAAIKELNIPETKHVLSRAERRRKKREEYKPIYGAPAKTVRQLRDRPDGKQDSRIVLRADFSPILRRPQVTRMQLRSRMRKSKKQDKPTPKYVVLRKINLRRFKRKHGIRIAKSDYVHLGPLDPVPFGANAHMMKA